MLGFLAKGAMTSAAVLSVQDVWVSTLLNAPYKILADASRTLQSQENGMHARWTQFGAHIEAGLCLAVQFTSGPQSACLIAICPIVQASTVRERQ